MSGGLTKDDAILLISEGERATALALHRSARTDALSQSLPAESGTDISPCSGDESLAILPLTDFKNETLDGKKSSLNSPRSLTVMREGCPAGTSRCI